jgi:hypothetical protein
MLNQKHLRGEEEGDVKALWAIITTRIADYRWLQVQATLSIIACLGFDPEWDKNYLIF